jgi:oligopeptide/dipeptide ABC transporter ATP-binding protein
VTTASAQRSDVASTGSAPLLAVAGLEVHFPVVKKNIFGRKPVNIHAVNGVDFRVDRGETLSIVGESGCGKSTMARALLQLEKPTAGTVTFDGVELTTLPRRDLRQIRQRMQMIFQDPYSSLNPRMTVEDLIAEPLEIHSLAHGPAKAARVRELLNLVGLSSRFINRFPNEFSGGQRQRIGIARALAAEPDFIVADEAVSALDVSIQAQIINLLDELQSTLGLTYLFIAHDLAVVCHVSDRVAVMYLGKIVEIASRDDIFDSPRHPYTVALLSAVPVPDPVVESRRERILLTGDVPSPVDLPSGCPFSSRCWLRTQLGSPDRCETESPHLREMGAGHEVACHFSDDLVGRDLARNLPMRTS